MSGLIAVASIEAFSANPASQPSKTSGPQNAQIVETYGKLPLSFEVNTGQADRRVKFLARGGGYGLYLTGQEAVLALRKGGCAGLPASGIGRSASMTQRPGPRRGEAACARDTAVVRMRLGGTGSGAAAPVGEEPLPGTANYFIGNDPAKWRTSVPTFSRVRYTGVYPGVDLVYYGNQRQLEYDFVVAPGADPKPIRLQFAGAKGLRLSADGDLVVTAAGGALAFHKPLAFQVVDGQRKAVAGSFALLARYTVGFRLGSYDRAKPLVIDPVLVYSTYLGGSGSDFADAIAADRAGNVYVTGYTWSTDFPVTSGAFQTTLGTRATNAFITKLNPAGTRLVYSTYVGGDGYDYANGLALDSLGNAYIAGETSSADFPVTKGAFLTTRPAFQTGFVTKLNASGTALVYSTYLGGSNGFSGDGASDVAVDGSGNAYIVGSASSTNFPVTKGAYQKTNRVVPYGGVGGSNAFVTKLNAAGSALVYSTYLGGSGRTLGNGDATEIYGDGASSLTVDATGNAYIAGAAYSTDFPTTKGAFQTMNNAAYNSAPNAFVTKLNPTGTALVYSTYLGGSGFFYKSGDGASGLAVDGSGNAYITGYALSADFPVTKGAFQTTNHAETVAGSNAFVTKLNPAGSALLYSTYLGGSREDGANGLAVDGSGNAYITGYAFSADFPVTKGAFQTTNHGAVNYDNNAFVTKLNALGRAMVYSTYLGGSHGDPGVGVAVDSVGNAYVAGQTHSADFPVTEGAFQTTNHGWVNAFVTKLDLSAGAQLATATTLSASANPAVAGALVKFSAAVTDSIGRAASKGSVVFKVDGMAASTGTVSGGKATYATSSLTAGRHTILASFEDSSNYYALSSAGLTETITEPQASAPVFSPAVGTYDTPRSVTLTDATKGATIYYTTNGNTPTTTPSDKYVNAITVSKTTTIKAIAAASGHTNSVVATGTYTITPPAPTPTFSPKAGTYTSTQTVKIADTAIAGLKIYYTTDGSTPTAEATRYTSAGVKVSSTETVKAVAAATGYSDSAVASAKYTIN